jgi:nicotinate-nucleotide pyrophosphorylase (carboxylating)
VTESGDPARVAALALSEDGPRDITSLVTVAALQQGEAILEARQALVLSGTRYADAVLDACGLPPFDWRAADGDQVEAGVLATVRGGLRAILRAERPLLNLLQRACGVATLTRRAAREVSGTSCRVLHTRKTTPGLRALEVEAVLHGGGAPHRVDLAATVLVKDNHWQALQASGRSLATALAEARAEGAAGLQVEVESLAQLREACAAGATRLLIDNQVPAVVATWTREARRLSPGIEVEASGGITLATLRDYAEAGVDFVSLGFLTHSVPSADLGLEVVAGEG